MWNGNGGAGARGARWTWTAITAVAALAVAPPAAAAQDELDEMDGPRISYTVYAGAGFDGYETGIQIAGATVRPSGNGIRPMVGLQAYRLGFDSGAGGTTEVFAVSPSVGVGYFTPDGQVSGMLGYAFVNEETPVFIGGGGGESGLTTAVQALYWGADPDVETIAAYSWEPEYLWTNAIVSQPVLAVGPGSLSLGVDGVYEKQMSTGGSSAYSLGPAVRWSNEENLGVTLAGGYRKAEARDATWYVRLGGAFYQ
jgi:hypothetical protein